MKIRHDIHTHTCLSRCCYDTEATVAAYIRRAAQLGHKVFGISNHLWDEKVPGASSWYQNQAVKYNLQSRQCLPDDLCGMKVMVGAETEYYAVSDTLGMLAETAKQFDYMLVPHSHTHMRNLVMADNADTAAIKELVAGRIASVLPELSAAQIKTMANSLGRVDTDAMAAAGLFFPPTVDMAKYCAASMLDSFAALMANSEFRRLAAAVPTAVAHPFSPCGFDSEMKRKIVRELPDDRLTACFTEAAKLGVAIEINTDAFRFPADDYAGDPQIHLMKVALAAGCKFTFGTDAHSLGALDTIRKGDDISRLVGINEDDLAEIVR